MHNLMLMNKACFVKEARNDNEVTLENYIIKVVNCRLKWAIRREKRYDSHVVRSLDCKSALWPWIQPLQKLNRSNTMDNNDRNSFITYINNKCTSKDNHMETKTRQRFLLFTTFTINALTTRNCDIEINEFSKWCSTNISYY